MAIEAVKIPQNVYVEDRIIGPVTLRQLLITGMGAGLSYAIFGTAQKSGVTNIVALGACWIPAMIGAAFSFLKINDLSLFQIILLSFEHMNKPSVRYWSPVQPLMINVVTTQIKKQEEEATAKAEMDGKKLHELTEQMERHREDLQNISVSSPATLDTVQAPEADDVASVKLPVQRDRVRTEGGIIGRSIDGIRGTLPSHA